MNSSENFRQKSPSLVALVSWSNQNFIRKPQHQGELAKSRPSSSLWWQLRRGRRASCAHSLQAEAQRAYCGLQWPWEELLIHVLGADNFHQGCARTGADSYRQECFYIGNNKFSNYFLEAPDAYILQAIWIVTFSLTFNVSAIFFRPVHRKKWRKE